MRLLLVDDCDITSELLRIYLEEELADAEITEYDVLGRGRPGPDFDWSAYDVLLLDYNLGKGDTGVGWLKAFSEHPDFPPTVLITAVGDPYVVANAVQAGADGYLNKADLTPPRLARAARDAIEARARLRADPPPRVPGDTTEFMRRFQREFRSERSPGEIDYRFGRLIGRGGTGQIYLAERVADRSSVVLKVIARTPDDDEDQMRRFIHEGELIDQLDDPHVVRIYERGHTESYAFTAMEFFARGDLKPRVERGLDPDTAVMYLRGIARGLEAIHSAGIVHRDLKPGNVMFRRDDSMALVDFGISKRIGAELDITRTGMVVGSPVYMSPEHALGEPLDARSDLYSAGVLFYEMLTGERPYVSESLSAILFQHLHADVPVLSGTLAPFNLLLGRLMAKKPRDRYRDATELLGALSALDIAA